MTFNQCFLKTKRCCLRNLKTQDAKTIFDYRNHLECAKYQRWSDTSKAYLDTWIEKYRHSNYLSSEKEQHYAICLHNDLMIGDLSYYVTPNDCITLGYTISYQYWRQGYAYEVLSALICDIRMHDIDLNIVALVDTDNQPSIGLLKKLGFRCEGKSEKYHSYIYVYPFQ